MWHKGPKPNDGIGRSCPISEFGFCEKKSSGQCYKTYWKEKGRDFPCNRNNKKRAFQKKLTVLEF